MEVSRYTPPQPTPPDEIVLRLSEAEARTLRQIAYTNICVPIAVSNALGGSSWSETRDRVTALLHVLAELAANEPPLAHVRYRALVQNLARELN